MFSMDRLSAAGVSAELAGALLAGLAGRHRQAMAPRLLAELLAEEGLSAGLSEEAELLAGPTERRHRQAAEAAEAA